jgi:hypothetical protein
VTRARRTRIFLASESPLYVGRAVAALAADTAVLARTGMLYGSWELARQYNFTDYDGRRPGGAGTRSTGQRCLRRGSTCSRRVRSCRIRWRSTLTARAKKFRTKLPA